MNALHFSWLEMAIVMPLLGAIRVAMLRDSERAKKQSIFFTGLTLLCTVGAWLDLSALHVFQAHDRWDIITELFGGDFFVVDELSAPLLPLAALLFLATAVATLRTKVKRFSFAGSLVSESILLAALSCKTPWGIIALLSIGTIPPLLELRARQKPMRVYVLHALMMIGLFTAGQWMIDTHGLDSPYANIAMGLLVAAVLIRSGVFPVHIWITDLFEHATFGTALLFVTPMLGAYSAVRLVLPIAPDWALQCITIMALFTAVYAAGMALIQREARRFFCYLFLSHSSLVLVGLDIATPIGLTGALSVWLSVGLALAGFGLTLRSMESRIGRVSLADYHGLYDHTPTLAAFFLLTGLASIGFPGTFGFVGTELLVEGAVDAYPFVGMAVVLAAALNGIAVVKTYFRVFAGSRHRASISLRSRLPEKVAVLTLAGIILGGGLLPQPGIESRHHAALEIAKSRRISMEKAEARNSEKPPSGEDRTVTPPFAEIPSR